MSLAADVSCWVLHGWVMRRFRLVSEGRHNLKALLLWLIAGGACWLRWWSRAAFLVSLEGRHDNRVQACASDSSLVS